MTNKGLISKICKQLIQLSIKRPTNLIKKWVEDLNRCFSSEEMLIVNRHEKMLNIANHQENANQNHKLSPHTCWNAYHQKEHKQQILAMVWRKENLICC